MIERPYEAVRPATYIPAPRRPRAMAIRQPSTSGLWRSLPLALALSGAWWAIGLGVVATLSHTH